MKRLNFLCKICFLLLLLTSTFSLESNAFSLIVLPDVREKGIDLKTDPFISLIDSAVNEILLASYKIQATKLPQKDFLDALERATNRGVKIYLITENRLTNEEIIFTEENTSVDAQNEYTKRGIETRSLKDYDQSHPKIVIVDRKVALIGNTNFDKDPEGHMNNQRPSRDFSIKTDDPEIIEALIKGFWKDFMGADTDETHPNLLWGPEGQREKFYQLIYQARKSIRIYQQDIQDYEICQKLCQAVKRGINVELIMSSHPFGFNNADKNIPNQKYLREVGVHVYLIEDLNIHAKLMNIDDKIVYIGSTNFYPPTLDKTRNVGILIEDSEIINEVNEIFDKDRSISDAGILTPIDLDTGLR